MNWLGRIMKWLRRTPTQGISTDGDVTDAINQAGQGNTANQTIINVQGVDPQTILAMVAENQRNKKGMVTVASSPPPSTKGFLDREKAVRELVELIRSREHKIIGITDQAGNGKSTFVMRVLEVLANLGVFPRATWIRLWDGFGFDDLTSRLLAELGIDDAIPDPRQRIDTIVARLAGPMVLVLDSFEYALEQDGRCRDAELGELLRTLSSAQHEAQILITSWRRPTDVEAGIHAYCSYPANGALGGLERDFAVWLLREEGVSGDDDVLANAAKQLGGNPKALQLLAGELKRHCDGDASVLASKPELLTRGADGLVEQIVGNLNDAERRLATRLPVLRRPVPREALVVLAGGEAAETDEAIAGLREQSLLDKSEEGGYWSLHSLVRETLEAQLDGEAHGLAAAYYASIESPRGLDARTLDDVYMLIEGTHHALAAGAWQVAMAMIRMFRFGLSQSEDLTDMLRRRGFASAALDIDLALAQAVPEVEVETWANEQNNLGIAYLNLPTGDRTENLRLAIAAFQATLRVYTEQDHPRQWAMTQNNLGIAHRNLPTGDSAENLRLAIEAYLSALRVYTKQEYGDKWASTQNNLGVAYAHLPTGDRAENLRLAIEAFQAALLVYSEREFPVDWAMTQVNQANLYCILPMGNRAENLRRAADAYQAALRVYTEHDYPAQWATTQNNLGNAYASLPAGDRGENLRRAIAAFHAALRVQTEKDFPREWVITMENLEVAERQLAELEGEG